MEHSMADLESVEQLTAWIVSETDAMCPLAERLQRFAADRTAAEFSDLRFHVEEAACPFCQQRLQDLGTLVDGGGPLSTAFREFWDRSEPPESGGAAATLGPEHPDAPQLKAEFAAHFEQLAPQLCGWIAKHFPRLAREAEDVGCSTARSKPTSTSRSF